MQSNLNPYLNFRNNARDAMEFYQSVFGGSLTITTFEQGGMDQYPHEGDKVMLAMLESENGITFMAADTPERIEYHPGNTISMSLSGTNEAELTGYFNDLSLNGTVNEPLTRAPWGDTFGMLTDQYGVRWMVNISGQQI